MRMAKSPRVTASCACWRFQRKQQRTEFDSCLAPCRREGSARPRRSRLLLASPKSLIRPAQDAQNGDKDRLSRKQWWRISMHNGSAKRSGSTITLSSKTTVVGRGPTCDLVIPHLSISRRHAELSLTGASLTVRDLKSRNGT